MKAPDWNAEAVVMAQYAGKEMFEAHRGAMPWKELGVSVVFGNDGYSQDVRAKQEVEFVRSYCERAGIAVLGFGVDPDDGYSWAMLVKSADHESLIPVAWSGWMPDEKTPSVEKLLEGSTVMTGYQPETGDWTIFRGRIKPTSSPN